jgi:hypothetical protein
VRRPEPRIAAGAFEIVGVLPGLELPAHALGRG